MLLIQKVSKKYPLYARPADRLWEALPWLGGKRHTDFWALRDVTLEVPTGQFVALVGPNGSGKSTLLQIVSGILQPTRGRVLRHGRVAALLELGAGFNPEFTGRENVLLNGEILGVDRKRMAQLLPRVEEFAEVGDFIHRPVKEYSSGMYVRLAFATAIHVDPEILIVDEALAVGDAVFAARCVRKFEELKDRGVTVFFVSHDLGLVKRLADRAVLMLHGRVEADGRPAEIVNRYIGMVHEWQNREVGRHDGASLGETFRHGDGTSEIVSVRLENAGGEPVRTIDSGSQVQVRVRARFRRPAADPMVGILIRNRLGIDVFGTNTRVEGRCLGEFAAGDELDLAFRFPCSLTQQEYTLTVAIQHSDGRSQDWRDDVLSFGVVEPRATAGLASLPVVVEWDKRVAR